MESVKTWKKRKYFKNNGDYSTVLKDAERSSRVKLEKLAGSLVT